MRGQLLRLPVGRLDARPRVLQEERNRGGEAAGRSGEEGRGAAGKGGGAACIILAAMWSPMSIPSSRRPRCTSSLLKVTSCGSIIIPSPPPIPILCFLSAARSVLPIRLSSDGSTPAQRCDFLRPSLGTHPALSCRYASLIRPASTW